jgi:hypothetical protein
LKFGQEHLDKLEEIYNEILESALIYHPDPNKHFTLETDASGTGYGGILRQDNKIVGIKSGKFNEQQRKYPPMEREFLAIVKCMIYFKNIIFGSRIEIITDNKNLLFDTDINCSKTQRWKLVLQDFDYKLIYKS